MDKSSKPVILKEIDGKFVHKSNKINIAISDIKKDERKENMFYSYVIVNRENLFFFENNRKHLPATLIVESARQSAMATLHIYYDMDFDKAFLINKFNCDFYAYANIEDTVKIEIEVIRNRSKFSFIITFYQNQRKIAQFTSSMFCMNQKIVERMEAAAHV